MVYERLKKMLPRWEVFYDHKSIPLGEPFPELLRQQVTTAKVVLVVIGPQWLEVLKQRKDGTAVDHVREEVRLALDSGNMVIPVPVGGARMPNTTDLALFPDLQPLASRNARPIRPEPDFDRDIESLVSWLETIGPGEGIGTVLGGKYKLVRELGVGGMGVVYAAEQERPRRTVAVKLIKPGMDSREILARFDAERQALAVMEHPNISRVIDGGTTASGRPWFAMELVQGIPITEYCDDQKLAPNDRLQLFIQVCGAVQHAHQKGIIHRDIKPSNVLVEMTQGQAVPKVIDFGLAKALGYKLTDMSLYSNPGTRVGTLEYSSPEQAAGNELKVDTRTDIYALGALLYELLAGTPPFTREELRHAGEDEMRRVLREKDPLRPSAKLSSSNTLPSVAANRQLEPGKLTGLLRGDLDWIVMKALEKEPNRRYETANGFARDVSRYLTHDPVDARPPTAGYRLRKFVRKNRILVAAAGLLVITFLGGLLGTSWGYYHASKSARAESIAKEHAQRKEKEAIEQRTLAEKREAEATATKDFLKSVLLLPSASYQLWHFGKANPNLTLRETLVQATKLIDGRFSDQPLIEAELRQTIGSALRRLGASADAEPFSRAALTILERELGPDHLNTLEAAETLAYVEQAMGRHEQSQKLFARVIHGYERQLGAEDERTLFARCMLGFDFIQHGKLADAEPLLVQVLASSERILGPNHRTSLFTTYNLGMLYGMVGRAEDGEQLLKRAIAGFEQIEGPDGPNTIESVSLLGHNYLGRGMLTLAGPLLERAFEVRNRMLGPKHPLTLASVMRLGMYYDGAAQAPEAMKMWKHAYENFDALPDWVKSQGLDHWAKVRVGSQLVAEKKYTEAERMLLEGYHGMCQKKVDQTILLQATDYLISLYSAMDRTDEVKKWQTERAKYVRIPSE